MRETHKEFMTLLGYFFLQNRKPEKALVLFRFLHVQFPDDLHVMKSLAHASILTGAYENGLRLADRFLEGVSDRKEEKLGHLLKSKSLWGLGREEEARRALSDFYKL